MSNFGSKIKDKCLKAIKAKPGLLRYELYNMGIGHRTGILLWVSRMVYEGIIVRVWDDVMRSWRLYPKGKEPQLHKPESKMYVNSLFSRNILDRKEVADYKFNKGHGNDFYNAFDEAFGILYIDLKILGIAAQELNSPEVNDDVAFALVTDTVTPILKESSNHFCAKAGTGGIYHHLTESVLTSPVPTTKTRAGLNPFSNPLPTSCSGYSQLCTAFGSCSSNCRPDASQLSDSSYDSQESNTRFPEGECV